MIPKNRPIQGGDLEILRQKLGLTVEDMSWMLGIAMPSWSRIVKKGRDLPLRDGTIALIVRYLDRHYEQSFIPVFSDPEEIMALIDSNPALLADLDGSMPLKKIGILVGRESSAGHRWKHSGRGISPAIARACLLIKQLAVEKGSIKDWVEIINDESQARGVENIWRHGKWLPSAAPAKAANDDNIG